MSPLTRRRFLAGGAAPVILRARQTQRPNVVLIITDDQGYGDLSLHGNPHLKTPQIDRIATEGVRFTQFQVSPVCSPTRASLMTGRYNYRTGVVDTYLGRSMMYPDEVTLAEVLARAGYRTGLFGKWHLGDNYPMRPIDQGFQVALCHKGGGIGQPSDPPGNHYFDPVLQDNGKPVRVKGYSTDIFFERALGFIESSRAQPFFAYIATNAPHTPLEVSEELAAPYRARGLDETTAKIYGMVKNIDDNTGRLLDHLARLGLEQNTIVIFLTDNGPQQQRFNAGMRGLKGSVYQGGIRVPFFLRWPAVVAPGKQVETIAAHIDVFPTLLEACGIALPTGLRIDGRSLLPLIRGRQPVWPERTLFTQWHRGDQPEPFRNCAVRTSRYKLVDGKQLYDLAADPAEQHDLAASNPKLVASLRAAYEKWFADISSTRGYAPPRIYIGTPHENPVILTRQDWRGPKASWEETGLGYWEVDVRTGGPYEIVLRLFPAPAAGKARFRLNNADLEQPIAAGATECRFSPVGLQAGPGRAEPVLEYGGRQVGVQYLEIRKLSGGAAG
jgi:arylsulfatase A-like enzyme